MRITSLTTPLGADAFGNDILVFRQLEGREGLNSLFDYTLTVHSARSDIVPKELIGKSVTVTVTDQYGSPRCLNAIVASFTFQGGDQRRTIYQAKLVPWLSLATYSADCRIFQNLSIVDIVTQVLGNYPFPIKKKLQDSYETLLFTVQYNESDFAFVSRLLERAGIGYYFEHDANGHTLVLTDQMSVYTAVPGHSAIPFRAPDAIGIADEETISRWNPQQSIKSGSYTTDDYSYRAPFAHLEQQGTGTVAPKQHTFDNLPVYHWQGQGHYADWQVGQDIVKLRQDQQQQQFQAVELDSNVRALAIGATGNIFTLTDHPHQPMNQQVLILATQTFIKENPSTTSEGDHTDWRITATVAPSAHQYRPLHVTPLPRIYGPQSAMVVGPAGQEIWTNDLGEVRLRFLWDRYASGDENSSCWIRVCSSWAGDSWGGEAVPRIGTEVIVTFLDGNPDHPIVMGRVANSARIPPSFSNTGSLPDNQALAGMKSRELGGNRYNQWLFDDTTGQIRMQLESEHAKTQLNMGYLVHPRSGSAEPRGEGYELRTDAAGVLRAAKGILVSAYARPNAGGNALSRDELTTLLKEAVDLAKTIGDFAAKNLGNASDPQPRETLSKAIKDLGHGSNAESGGNGATPLIALSAPAGIALGTPLSTTIATGEHIDLVAAQNQQLTAGKKMNLHAGEGMSNFAVKGGIKSIAHQGPHIIKAHDDVIQIAADQSVTVTSSHGNVTVAADKYVLLTSGGGFIKIADGNIQMHCPGTIDMKAGNYSLTGPASANYTLPVMPNDVCKPCLLNAANSGAPYAAKG